MTETKRNLVENIKGIRKGIGWGLAIPGFSNQIYSNLSGLLEAITQKEELEAFSDFVGEYVGSKELEILLRKNITTPDGKTKSALSFVPEGFLIKALKKENILGLSDESLALITPEQWSILPEEEREEIAMQLAKANRLQNLSEESLEVITKKLDLYHRYGVNIASSRLTESELKTQLTSLIETEKLGSLAKEAIGKITDEIMVSFGDEFIKQLPAETIDYLATVKGNGVVLVNMKLCALDINSVPVEEFKKLKPETIATLNPKQIGKLDEDHIKSLTIEQAKNLSEGQIDFIVSSGNLSLLSTDILNTISEKIDFSLAPEGEIEKLSNNRKLEVLGPAIKTLDVKKLNDKELEIINNTDFSVQDNLDSICKDMDSALEEAISDINYKQETPNYKEIEQLIDQNIQEGNWQELKERVVKLYAKKDSDALKFTNKTLDEKIANTKKDAFGYSDKIELLKVKILITDNPSDTKKIYNNLTNSINNLINLPSISYFESVSKINTLLSIANDSNFSSNLRESVFKNLTTIVDKFEKENFSDKDITLSNDMLNLRRNVYAGYADYLANKYPEISIENIESKEDSDLSLPEREFKKSIGKVNIDDGILNSLKSSWGTYKTLGVGAIKRWLFSKLSASGNNMETAYFTATNLMTANEIKNINDLNEALKFEKKTVNNQRQKKESFFNKIHRFFKRLENFSIKKIGIEQKQEAIDAATYSNRSKNETTSFLKEQLEKNKNSKIEKIIEKFKTNSPTRNLRIEIADLKIKAIEEKASRKKMSLNNSEITDPKKDVINKEKEKKEINNFVESKINEIRVNLCNKLIPESNENLRQKFESFKQHVEQQKNQFANMYSNILYDSNYNRALLNELSQVIEEVKKDENNLDLEQVEALHNLVKSSLNNGNIPAEIKEKNIEAISTILSNGNILNSQDLQIVQNVSEMLSIMSAFIASQLKNEFVVSAATDTEEQKRQELLEQQDKINYLQNEITTNSVASQLGVVSM